MSKVTQAIQGKIDEALAFREAERDWVQEARRLCPFVEIRPRDYARVNGLSPKEFVEGILCEKSHEEDLWEDFWDVVEDEPVCPDCGDPYCHGECVDFDYDYDCYRELD